MIRVKNGLKAAQQFSLIISVRMKVVNRRPSCAIKTANIHRSIPWILTYLRSWTLFLKGRHHTLVIDRFKRPHAKLAGVTDNGEGILRETVLHEH